MRLNKQLLLLKDSVRGDGQFFNSAAPVSSGGDGGEPSPVNVILAKIEKRSSYNKYRAAVRTIDNRESSVQLEENAAAAEAHY